VPATDAVAGKGRSPSTSFAGPPPLEIGGRIALKHWCMTHQIKACELNLVGYEDEDD
jgi:hypothetical protein